MSGRLKRAAFSIDPSSPLWFGRAGDSEVMADAQWEPEPEEPDRDAGQPPVMPAHAVAKPDTRFAR